jgi:hypothetical protein
MAISLKLLDSDLQFRTKILFALSTIVNKALTEASPSIKLQVSEYIKSLIANTSTVYSLMHGDLRGAFGLDDDSASKAITEIVEEMGNSVHVDIAKPRNKKAKTVGDLFVTIRPNINAITLLRSGSYFSDGRIGGNVDWLTWLLTRGTEVVVGDFSFFLEDTNANSRSGLGFMIETGNNFRVDPEFSGTVEDNFITRAISSSESTNEIRNIINREIRKHL